MNGEMTKSLYSIAAADGATGRRAIGSLIGAGDATVDNRFLPSKRILNILSR